MLELLMILAMTCAPTQVSNRSEDPLNAHDTEMMQNSAKVCFEKYSPRSPCLSRFIKIRPRGYYAICGPTSS